MKRAFCTVEQFEALVLGTVGIDLDAGLFPLAPGDTLAICPEGRHAERIEAIVVAAKPFENEIGFRIRLTCAKRAPFSEVPISTAAGDPCRTTARIVVVALGDGAFLAVSETFPGREGKGGTEAEATAVLVKRIAARAPREERRS